MVVTVNKLRISQTGIDLICSFEGFRAAPYRCPAGIPTIGYGSTRYPGGVPVKMTDPPITEERAKRILAANLDEYEKAVNRYVQVPLNQNQIDALVSFTYNCGPQNLRTSTLLRMLNQGDYAAVPSQLMRWTKAYVQGRYVTLKGLVRRREAEGALFARAVA